MRLRQLVQEYPGRITLEHRAFILRPEDEDARFAPYHLQHRLAAMQRTGLPFDLPEVGSRYPRSSFPALESAKWVEEHHPEKFDAYDLAIFSAFFERTEDISRSQVLAHIAGTIGIPTAGLSSALEGHHYREAVVSDYMQAVEAGTNGIPTVLFGDEAITGAVPYEHYRRAAQAILKPSTR